MPIFKKQKTPPIEIAINERLTGEAQSNALDFVAFARANGISLHGGGGGEVFSGWDIAGTAGASIGYIIVNGVPDFPGPWTIWLNSCDFVGDADDELKGAAWAHASPCGKCNKGWEKCGGGPRTIFGKDFDRLCHSPLMFTNPDAQALEHAKKLLLMLK